MRRLSAKNKTLINSCSRGTNGKTYTYKCIEIKLNIQQWYNITSGSILTTLLQVNGELHAWGPAVPCDRGRSAHLCSHLLRRGRIDIKSLLQALPAHYGCAHGCQDECAAIGSSRLSFSSAPASCANHQENKTAVVGTCKMRWPFSLGSQRNKKDALLSPVLCFLLFFLLLLLWMRKWEGLGNRMGEWVLRWMDFLECAQAKTGVIQSIDFAWLISLSPE